MSATTRAGKNPGMTDDESDDDEPAIVREFRQRLLDRYPQADDVSEALRLAEQAPSTTDLTDEQLCPSCGSRQVARKDGHDMTHKTDTEWVCRWCRTHFDQAVEQTTLEGYE